MWTVAGGRLRQHSGLDPWPVVFDLQVAPEYQTSYGNLTKSRKVHQILTSNPRHWRLQSADLKFWLDDRIHRQQPNEIIWRSSSRTWPFLLISPPFKKPDAHFYLTWQFWNEMSPLLLNHRTMNFGNSINQWNTFRVNWNNTSDLKSTTTDMTNQLKTDIPPHTKR